MITAIQNSEGHIHLFLGILGYDGLDYSFSKNIKRQGLVGKYESEGYLQTEADIKAFKEGLSYEDREKLEAGHPVFVEDPGYLNTPLFDTLKRILSENRDPTIERRLLDYLGPVPVIWDIPKDFLGVRIPARCFEVLEKLEKIIQKEYLEALREGFKLPRADVFCWISTGGEIDYGLVQDHFFITLWVMSPEKVTPEKLKRMAREKLNDTFERYRYVLKQTKNPFLSVEERREYSEVLSFYRHPSFESS